MSRTFPCPSRPPKRAPRDGWAGRDRSGRRPVDAGKTLRQRGGTSGAATSCAPWPTPPIARPSIWRANVVPSQRSTRIAFLLSPFVAALPEHLQMLIRSDGIRNGHLLAVAPAGTISLLAGNVSSGIEPIFRPRYQRVVQRLDGRPRRWNSLTMPWRCLNHCRLRRRSTRRDGRRLKHGARKHTWTCKPLCSRTSTRPFPRRESSRRLQLRGRARPVSNARMRRD